MEIRSSQYELMIENGNIFFWRLCAKEKELTLKKRLILQKSTDIIGFQIKKCFFIDASHVVELLVNCDSENDSTQYCKLIKFDLAAGTKKELSITEGLHQADFLGKRYLLFTTDIKSTYACAYGFKMLVMDLASVDPREILFQNTERLNAEEFTRNIRIILANIHLLKGYKSLALDSVHAQPMPLIRNMFYLRDGFFATTHFCGESSDSDILEVCYLHIWHIKTKRHVSLPMGLGVDIRAVSKKGKVVTVLLADGNKICTEEWDIRKQRNRDPMLSFWQRQLYIAAFTGNIHLAECCLNHGGADINALHASGFSALHLAISQFHLHMVCVLIQNGADVAQVSTSSEKLSPLTLACICHKSVQSTHSAPLATCIKFPLVNKGPAIASAMRALLSGERKNRALIEIVLIPAILRGDEEAVNAVIGLGIDLDYIEPGLQNNLLHIACNFLDSNKINPRIIAALKQAGVTIDALNRHKRRPQDLITRWQCFPGRCNIAALSVLANSRDVNVAKFFQALTAWDKAALTQLIAIDPSVINAGACFPPDPFRRPTSIALLPQLFSGEASESTKIDIIRFLIEQGLRTDVEDPNKGHTLVDMARTYVDVGRGDFTGINLLRVFSPTMADNLKLMQASGEGDLSLVNNLLHSNADVNFSVGLTRALGEAIKNQHVAVVSRLLKEPTITITTVRGVTVEVRKTTNQTIKKLFQSYFKGKSLDVYGGAEKVGSMSKPTGPVKPSRGPTIDAKRLRRQEDIQEKISDFEFVEFEKVKEVYDPLEARNMQMIQAVMHQNESQLTEALENGANVNYNKPIERYSDFQTITALEICCGVAYSDERWPLGVRLLVEYGANRDVTKNTSLHEQVWASENIELIRSFDGANAAANALLSISSRENNLAKMTEALQQGADVNFKSIEGYTALHLACKRLNSEAVEILMSAGADPSIKCPRFSGVQIWKKQDESAVELLDRLIRTYADPKLPIKIRALLEVESIHLSRTIPGSVSGPTLCPSK